MPAREHTATLAYLGGRALEHCGELVARQLLGERRDRQGEQHPTAHREDVGQGVGRGDFPVEARVVDDRRKEVERPDHRQVRRDEPRRPIVRWLQPRDQLRRRHLRAEAGQRVGEQVGPQLRGASAAVGQLGQPHSRAGDKRHFGIIGPGAGHEDDPWEGLG